MSLFPAGAPQIWREMPPLPKSQFHGRNDAGSLRFVSQGAVRAKWRDGCLGRVDFRYTVPASHLSEG
jgi:hypothetical protein